MASSAVSSGVGRHRTEGNVTGAGEYALSPGGIADGRAVGPREQAAFFLGATGLEDPCGSAWPYA